MSDPIEPNRRRGVPWCFQECGSYNWKECRLLGYRPNCICEPAVKLMAEEIKQLESAVARLESEKAEEP